MEREYTCFVIMPFSKSAKHSEAHWTTFYTDFLKPLIEEIPNITVHRSKVRREDILSEIIKNLITADIVVADITDHNPNVFWELGIRQSFKHGTITIAKTGTKPPFDVGKKGIIYYDTKAVIKNEAFRKQFKEALQDCIDSPNRPDSTVLETISGRSSLFEIIRHDEAKRRIEALIQETEFNAGLYVRIVADSKKNRERAGNEFTTQRFRTGSIELLITNRYLNLEDSYENLAAYYSSLQALNGQRDNRQHNPSQTEKWFIENESFYKERFELISNIIEKIKSQKIL